MMHSKQYQEQSSAVLTNRNRYEMQLLMLNPIVTTG